jgi:Leucine-rich repeat (LRR) protein
MDAALPLEELAAGAAPEDVLEVSQVGHSLVSTRQIARLASFTSLRSLVLHGGSLRALGPLPPSLEELNLSGNALEVAPLHSLPRLTTLNLASNRLRALDFLAQLPRLTSLNLAHNELRTLDGLATAPALAESLTALDARGNLLLSLTPAPGRALLCAQAGHPGAPLPGPLSGGQGVRPGGGV